MSKRAAVTIISKNYMAYATTLANSYKDIHPLDDFLIVLVDRADNLVPSTLPCGAEIIEIANIPLPDISRFIYRYSIMELNTAVKPFVLSSLFATRDYEKLLYIDPDIYIFSDLSAIYNDLDTASIVLTPHIRRPYNDDLSPSDLTILQSGTYNLGFIGLRKSNTSDALLTWWMEKLHRDCIVDIQNGVFVDQKWIDLVPSFFPDHKIHYGAGCNAAYWNLHERPVKRSGNAWLVDETALVFFHFSGYDPFLPLQLSKHQNRHQLELLPDLKELTDFYAAELLANNYLTSSAWPYAFQTLSNGVRIPLREVAAVMQWAVRNRIKSPCPVTSPDDFCRFLMSRGWIANTPKVVLIFHFLLRHRGDVSAAFPAALKDSDDAGFRKWLIESGTKELEIGPLLAYEQMGLRTSLVEDLFRKLRSGNSSIIAMKLTSLYDDFNQLSNFDLWLEPSLQRIAGLKSEHKDALESAFPKIATILNIYFLRGDLQVAFENLADRTCLADFTSWLSSHPAEFDLSPDDIFLFSEFVTYNCLLIEQMRFLYTHLGSDKKISPNLFWVNQRRIEVGSGDTFSTADALDFLLNTTDINPANHYLEALKSDAIKKEIDSLSIPGLNGRKTFSWRNRLRKSLNERDTDGLHINLAAYTTAPTGMGESGRSMQRILSHTHHTVAELTLPHGRATHIKKVDRATIFGWPAANANISITVANADATASARSFLPKVFSAAKNVGYWVWETERLPPEHARWQMLYDEIWTPSNYSARAIAASVGVPVKVLPHALDFESLRHATRNRKAFGLPENVILFGYMFDPESNLERKNVRDLIAAFRMAFQSDVQCMLVLKVNGHTSGNFNFEMLRAQAADSRVVFLDVTLSREATYDFLASLDVYVSLHRSEGFGLTCAEAMALGLPVVATGYSGNLDFMNDTNSILVNYLLQTTIRPNGSYPPGTMWAQPSIEHAAAAMQSLLSSDLRRDIGLAAKTSISTQLSATTISKTLEGLLLS